MAEQGWDDGDEATAVVNLADLRRQSLRASAKKYHLLITAQGTELGRVRELTGEIVLVGRSVDAELWLGNDGLSRKHARFIKTGSDYVLEDLNSANGTFVQGEKITRKLLKEGDQIQMGPTAIFRYSLSDGDQKALLEQLYSTSVTDSLTGARNREFLDSLLLTELSYAERHDNDLSFMLFDLDHFKKINDTHGHPAGDAILVAVAAAVRKQLRAEDSLCRYGGEEFCVVLRAIDLPGAHATAERIREVLDQMRVEHDGKQLTVTASIGCSTRSELAESTSAALIALADKRLYIAKGSGRNRVVSTS